MEVWVRRGPDDRDSGNSSKAFGWIIPNQIEPYYRLTVMKISLLILLT